MTQRSKHSPRLDSPASPRRCLAAAALLLCCMSACTPLRDLSSYSDDRSPSGGANPDAPAGRLSSSPARDDGGSETPRDADAPRPPPANPAADAGSSNAPLACDAPQELAAGDGHCYLLGAEASSWLASSVACSDWGGALARIDSPEEEALLSQNTSVDTWIGLNDRELEGDMRWADDSELGAYSHWAPQQPDDFDGSEDCVELLSDDRGWNDRPCTDLRAYLCER